MDSTPKNKAMTKDEIHCLVELIGANKIITSKETNASTNKLKDEAWVSLTAAFNARNGSIPRHKDQLKLKWDNLKKAARKRAQQIRMNNLKTGGRKPDFIPPDETLSKVESLLRSTCSGFVVPFGGDGVGDTNTSMSKSLKTKEKKRNDNDDSRHLLNMAAKKYYDKKTEKVELEIKLLRIELANKMNNCTCNINK